MHKESITREIQSISEQIQQLSHTVRAQQGDIQPIDLDLLMDKVRHLYNSLLQLRQLVAQPPVPPPPPARHTDELIATVEPTSTLTSEPAPAAPASPEPEAPAEEPVEMQAPITHTRTREFTRPAAKPVAATLFDDAASVADKYQASPSLHDKLTSAREDKSLAGKLSRNPVTDLKKSIGINEKFAFINDLFEGDMKAYSEAVNTLNGCSNHEEARAMLDNLSAQYEWAGDGETLEKFKNLIDRRFT